MSLGNFIKLIFLNGEGPPYRNAAYHNRLEEKLYELDQLTLKTIFGNNIRGVIDVVDADTPLKTGFYSLQTPFSNGPTASAYLFFHQEWTDGGHAVQYARYYNSDEFYIRRRNTGTWSSWSRVWNSGNDGNAGQQPAPKPRAGTSDSDIGRWRLLQGSADASVVLPSGGTWAYNAFRFNTSTGVFHAASSGVAAGGTTIVSALSGYTGFSYIWRVA